MINALLTRDSGENRMKSQVLEAAICCELELHGAAVRVQNWRRLGATIASQEGGVVGQTVTYLHLISTEGSLQMEVGEYQLNTLAARNLEPPDAPLVGAVRVGEIGTRDDSI